MERGNCPKCKLSFTMGSGQSTYIDKDNRDRHWWLAFAICPGCDQLVVWLVTMTGYAFQENLGNHNPAWYSTPPDGAQIETIFPKVSPRGPAPPEVPPEFAEDYVEACLTFADSPKASAALSRRCLQHILQEKLGAQGRDLYHEIRWAIENANLPSSIVDLLDVPRKVGNKAAHPALTDAGVIVDVEPWEAEWCLEIVEALFDHVFVLPAKNRERLERLGQKPPASTDLNEAPAGNRQDLAATD